MANKDDLSNWVLDAARQIGPCHVVDVAKHIWEHHEAELRQSGDLFFTWQYAMRWEAQKLRGLQKLGPIKEKDTRWYLGPKG